MAPIRNWLKRLERSSREDLESFELLDGSRYYFDPSSPDLFMFWYECIRAGSAHDWPEPPEVLRKLCEAKDVERAVDLVRVEGSSNFVPYDPEVLVSERRLKPRPLASRYDPDSDEHVPLDPYEDHVEDLSE